MALPGPVRASKFGGSGSILKRVYGNIRALDFQSFQELWVGLKRQTRLRTGTSPRLPELSSSFSEAAVCSFQIQCAFRLYGFINYKNSIQIGK